MGRDWKRTEVFLIFQAEKMAKLSVIIITKNEAKIIRKCLDRIQWADELLIVDSFSSDDTVALCENYTEHVYQRAFDDFQNQRNYALDKATGEWILSLDADEIVGDLLRNEIQQSIEQPGQFDLISYCA